MFQDQPKTASHKPSKVVGKSAPVHPKIANLKKKETGMGVRLLTEIKSQCPNDPYRQVGEFFERFPIPAGTGRKRTTSFQTHKAYRERLTVFVRALKELNMPIRNLDEISAKQVKKVFQHFETEGRSASWLANVNTVVRRFGIWQGKPHMCPALPDLLVNPSLAKRQYSALVAKDWEARGVDVDLAINRVETICEVTGLQLRASKEFGVRVQEFIMCKPAVSMKIPGYLDVRDGAKGGRRRSVPIETDAQREVLARLCEIAEKHPEGLVTVDGHRSLRQAIKHFYYQISKVGINKKELGITAHGLRHGYACRIYKLLTGVDAPVMGGGVVAPEDDRKARDEIAERLGHSRRDIVSAYLGSHKGLEALNRKTMDRLKTALDQDPVLNEIAIRSGIESFCVVGPAADGHAIAKDQVLCVGYRATRMDGETNGQADRRVVAAAMDMAIRVGLLLEVTAASVPINSLASAIKTCALAGVTCPRKAETAFILEG